MVLIKHFIVAATTIIAGALAGPAFNEGDGIPLLPARDGNTPSSNGTHDGYYYSWYTDEYGTAYYKNLAGGQYSVEWAGNGFNMGGKGWNPGNSDRNISYSGTFKPNGYGYLSVHGWTRSPLVEYYIVESYTFVPSSAARRMGTIYCNGANYDVLQTTRVNQTSIDGTQTFLQFWSVRNPKKNPGGAISGKVSTACHFDGWKQYGMNLGLEHNYQIFATYAYVSSGSSDITVSD